MTQAWKSIDENPPVDVKWTSIDEGPPPPGDPRRRRRLIVAGAELGLFLAVAAAIALFRWGGTKPAAAPPATPPALAVAEPPPPLPLPPPYGPDPIDEDIAPPRPAKPPEPVAVATPEPPPPPEPVAKAVKPAEPLKLVFPSAPARSPAAETYLREWEAAAHRVAQRDFDTAASRLRKTSRESREEEVRAEVKTDLEDVLRVGALHEEIVETLSRLARGTAASFDFMDEKGEARQVSGRVVRADRDRVELRPADGPTVFVEFSDIPAPRLLSHRPGAGADERAIALLLLLEGHAEEAWLRLGRKTDAVDPKYWIFARELRAKTPAPDLVARRRELDARSLYYAAEREHRSPRTRALAAEKYRVLAREFAETSLVRRAIQRITPRGEAPQEYYWAAADARGGGTFRLETRPGIGVVWTSIADSSLPKARENFVELEFHAETEKAYRLWVQAGGCCLEVLSCYTQCSELTAAHPTKPKTTVFIEPGSIYGLTAKPPAINLKPSHASHDPSGAKRPEAWGWIEIALPRFANAGPKKVRIITDQQGFAVARALVSTARKAAPDDAAVRELDEARAADLLPPAR